MADEIEQRPDETDEEYIQRLRITAHGFLDQHYHENADLPQFASDIMGPGKRQEWEKRQLEQWNQRHPILNKLVQLDKFEDAIPRIELRQRWLTDDGKAFLDRIIDDLRRKRTENSWVPYEAGLDFGEVTLGNGKKFKDFHYVAETSNRNYRDLRGADLCRQPLLYSNLQGTDLLRANLRYASLSEANLKDANLRLAKLKGANLPQANLMDANLRLANLKDANLRLAKLKGADLDRANLNGADLSYTTIAEPTVCNILDKKHHANPEIKNNSANLSRVKYSLEWRGPLWAAFIATIIVSPLLFLFRSIWHVWKWEKPFWQRFEWKKFAWERQPSSNIIKKIIAKITPRKPYEYLRKEREKVFAWFRKLCKQGHPTKFTGIDTSQMDASKNPGLKRDIEDEQFIEDFHEKHPILYWLWAKSSDCGRCLTLWATWSLIIAVFFGAIYAHYIPYPDWMPQDGIIEDLMCPEFTIDYSAETSPDGDAQREETFFTPYYYSVVTFTTLGFGDIKPKNLSAEILLTIEVVLGYFFLGGLVSILATKLARRS